MNFFKTLISSIKFWVDHQIADLKLKIDRELEQKQPIGDYAYRSEADAFAAAISSLNNRVGSTTVAEQINAGHTWETIKNPPFGEEDGLETLLNKTFSSSSATTGMQDEKRHSISLASDLIEGETYAITYDGTKYECVAYISERNNNGCSIGNEHHCEPLSGLTNTGEPFFITNRYIYHDKNVSGYKSVTVQKKFTTITTLDEKFIPSTIARTSDIPTAVDTAVTEALTEAKESGEFDGAPGTPGADGKDGQNGADGTSVTVTSVTESTEDGGSNVVTFSDGKTLTVLNGKTGENGADGKTPVKGTDYYTEADKTEMVNSVLAALPTWNGGSY